MRNRKTIQIEYRNMIICMAWEYFKNNLTMEDLAEIFNISLKSIYRILRAENKKLTNK